MFKKIDGFDHYMAPGAAASAMAAYLTQAGYVSANITTTNFALVVGSDGVGGALKLNMQAGAQTPPIVSYKMTTTSARAVFGFNFRGTGARQRVARINNVLDLDWDVTTGRFRVGSYRGANVIILNAWWYVEIEIDKSTEEVKVFANDALQMTVPLPSELSSATDFTLTWGMSSPPESAGSVEIDDFYCLDADPTDDADNVTRRGPMAIITRRPTADVETGWNVVNSASGQHWEIAAQLDPARAGAPYLQANVDGTTDKFLSNVVMPNDNEIFAVALVSYARKGDLDDRQLGMLIETNGGELEKRVTLSESFRFHQLIFGKAPGGLPWDKNRVETSEFGPVAR